MDLVTVDSIFSNENHQNILNKLEGTAKDVVENILYGNHDIRSDVLEKIAQLQSGDSVVYFSKFLSNRKIDPEWYELFQKIYKEHEDSDFSEYLTALETCFLDGIPEIRTVEELYNTCANCFKFRKGLETVGKTDEKKDILEANTGKSEPKPQNEEVCEKFAHSSNSQEQNTQKTESMIQEPIPEQEILQKREENIFELFCRGQVYPENTQQTHGILLENAIKAKEEYMQLCNQLAELQKVIAMQKIMKERYQERVQFLENELALKRTENEELIKKNSEIGEKLSRLRSLLGNAMSEGGVNEG